jgi:hypothetical protein
VYDEVLLDPAFFLFLLRIDEEFASEIRREGCRQCGAALHVADFPRKPRGCPAAVVEEFSWRFSFTCGKCKRRATSLSVRFLGRRVYVAVVLMLVSPPQGVATRQLCNQLSVPVRTLQRWRRWWTEEFLRTPFWQATRSRFMPPVLTAQLPASLLDRFEVHSPTERLAQALRLLSPLSV